MGLHGSRVWGGYKNTVYHTVQLRWVGTTGTDPEYHMYSSTAAMHGNDKRHCMPHHGTVG